MKIVRIAIFLTGIIGLAMGGITTISSLKSNQEESTLKSNEYLKSQGALLVDQFFNVLESVRNESQTTTGATLSYVTHRAIVKIDQGVPTEFESFTNTSSVQSALAQVDLALQDRVIASLKEQIAIADLQISRIGLGTYDLTDVGNKEGIYIATPIYKITNGVTDPSTIEKINVVLIDPAKAFAGIQKFNAIQDAAAYLISKKGHVLAHSISSYVGTDVKKIGRLKETIDNLFLGAQTGSVNAYTSVDGTKERVAFIRAGTYPFAFAVEQKANPAILSSAWVSEQIDSGAARKNIGIAFIVIAMALMSFSGISVWTSKQVSKQISENAALRREQSESSPFQTREVPPSIALVERATDDFVLAKSQIKNEQNIAKATFEQVIAPSQDLVKDFAAKIAKGYTLEGIEKELVEVSSELSESPVLFFRYHRRNQNLTLSSLAGSIRVPNYSVMQAYVRKDIELQIENLANEGKVASISNYGPMSKLIVSHLNVAHFEAWAVTSSQEVSGQSKMVGVLVILQAGPKSAQARPILARVLKEAGNYLYAQGNKLKPRTSRDSNQESITMDDSII